MALLFVSVDYVEHALECVVSNFVVCLLSPLGHAKVTALTLTHGDHGMVPICCVVCTSQSISQQVLHLYRKCEAMAGVNILRTDTCFSN